jgi:hypothetical protein
LTAIALTSVSTLAHHDPGNIRIGRPVSWVGTVSKVSWDGAHVMYLVDVVDATGGHETWQVLAASPYRLNRRGIAKSDIKRGASITVAGYLNVYSKVISPVYFELTDGRRLFTGYFNTDADFKDDYLR